MRVTPTSSPNNPFSVGPESWALLMDVLQSDPSVERIVVFGSRAKGTHHNGSDIDLAVQGQLSPENWQRLLIHIDDLELIYRVDLVNLSNPTLDVALKDHIERVGREAWRR